MAPSFGIFKRFKHITYSGFSALLGIPDQWFIFCHILILVQFETMELIFYIPGTPFGA